MYGQGLPHCYYYYTFQLLKYHQRGYLWTHSYYLFKGSLDSVFGIDFWASLVEWVVPLNLGWLLSDRGWDSKNSARGVMTFSSWREIHLNYLVIFRGDFMSRWLHPFWKLWKSLLIKTYLQLPEIPSLLSLCFRVGSRKEIQI